MSKAARIYYLAPINTPAYEQRIGTRLLIGAASRKVISVTETLRRAGSQAWIVAAPMLERKPWRWAGARVLRQGRAPVVCLATVNLRILNRLLAALNYLGFLLLHHRAGDSVIFYNYFPEYLPAALYLRLRGSPALLDIEDAPRDDHPGLRSAVERLTFPLLRRLCAERCLAASRQIAELFGSSSACVVYGVMNEAEAQYRSRDFHEQEIRILFGGSLSPELGLDLFCSAVMLAAQRPPPEGGRHLKFIVTGFGGEEQIAQLSASIRAPHVSIVARANLPVTEYRLAVQNAHVGLSLRMPASSYSNTTFPSKVVELTAAGLLLISTLVSDVSSLFGPDAALFLSDASPETLCDLFYLLLTRPDACAAIALRGHQRALEHFGSAAVGRRLREFVHA